MATTEIDFGSPTVLVVAWRGAGNAHGRVLKSGGDVIASLRRYATAALDTVRTAEGRPYDPNDEQDDESPYLEADRDELLDTALLDTILKAASLPQATDDDLRKRTLALYALVIGDDPDKLTAFVRRGNPVQLAKKGLVTVFDRTLTRVERPLLAFDEKYDVIIFPGQVYVLNQKNFEGLFKESEAVLAKTSEWAESLSQALPMSEQSIQWMAKRLRETSVMRRRVQSILKSDYLRELTPDLLRSKMVQRGLSPQDLMDDDGLIINKETERDILLLLNEDLWTGDFSGEQYAATRKARR
ncbi:MAG TPA: Kiwa anti-phage protein KwaB-like domain-containing protein [Streptosporangiaceae bacterium]